MSDISETLSNLLSESRRFFPPVELAINANVKIESYQEASEDRLDSLKDEVYAQAVEE